MKNSRTKKNLEKVEKLELKKKYIVEEPTTIKKKLRNRLFRKDYKRFTKILEK